MGPGKSFVVAAHNVVGWAVIRYIDPADAETVVDVYRSTTKVKTITFPAGAPFGNEAFTYLLPPSEMGVTGRNDDSLEIQVVSGSLRIAAIVALAADQEYVRPEAIQFRGPGWLAAESSRSGLWGRPTDVAGATAQLECPGRALQWLISGNPGAKLYETWSPQTIMAPINNGGNYHVFSTLPTPGSGAHAIRCTENNATGDQANGHALHVGGAIVLYDRI